MTILAAGVSPQDFTGPGGIGSPTYTSASAPTYGTWGSGSISILSATVMPSNIGFACLYSPWSTTANTFCVSARMQYGLRPAFTPPVTSGTAYRIGMIFYTGDDHVLLLVPNGTANTYDLALSPNVADWSTYTYLNIPFTLSNTWFTVGIAVSGAGTSDGKITLSVANSSNVVTQALTWTGDLTDYKDFKACSVHDPCSGGSTTTFASIVVDTENVFPATVLQYIPKTLGTLDEWDSTSNWTTPFNTFPYASVTYTDGLMSSSGPQKITFAASQTFYSTIPPNYMVKTMVVDVLAQAVSATSGATLRPVYYRAADASLVTCGDTQTVTGTLTQHRWDLRDDPRTGFVWSVNDIASYQFGLERVS